MAVSITMDFEGATLDQYDQVIAKMGFTPGGKGAPGALSHQAWSTPTGLTVIDVWQTIELFQDFADNQIGPITIDVGFPGPPKLEIHELHNYLTEG